MLKLGTQLMLHTTKSWSPVHSDLFGLWWLCWTFFRIVGHLSGPESLWWTLKQRPIPVPGIGQILCDLIRGQSSCCIVHRHKNTESLDLPNAEFSICILIYWYVVYHLELMWIFLRFVLSCFVLDGNLKLQINIFKFSPPVGFSK
jgi:hypothetical protein